MQLLSVTGFTCQPEADFHRSVQMPSRAHERNAIPGAQVRRCVTNAAQGLFAAALVSLEEIKI